jgi:cytochrome c peroxidase
MKRSIFFCTVALAGLVALSACVDDPVSLAPPGADFNRGQAKKGASDPPPAGDIVEFGARLFADENLSVNRNQSCQTCHEPSEGFAAALPVVTDTGSVVEGSVQGRFGDRKPPSAAYATLTPLFSGGNNPIGGIFWDGRATGHVLGNPAADQAMGPFLNPVEQGLPDAACVVHRVLTNSTLYKGDWAYAAIFPDAPVNVTWATDIEAHCSNPDGVGPFFTGDAASVQRAYENIALAIAAFEGSDRVNRFNSRFDLGEMTAFELEGQKLFSSKGKCQQCHENRGDRPVFTDFKFHNLGVPRNPANPVYGVAGFDPGLGGVTGQARHLGKFRTPTTRNVALGSNRTYMHNGAIATLIQVVDFYNTRDVLPVCTDSDVLADPTRWGSTGFHEFPGAGCWPEPEHGQNLDTKNMGKLGLSHDEVRAIVAYLAAMSDS